MSFPRPAAPLAAHAVTGGVLLAGLAGWMGIAWLLGAGPVGFAIMAALVIVPGGILGAQFAMMSPEARRPVEIADDGSRAPRVRTMPAELIAA